ncbi:MAG: site-2 protease family protein, partial [Lachnospiraceae bacterium]|nr:site-2 protease family protein [Lachnospiraceae bacterium]
MTIIYALIMFCILVLVHEGGHFIAAKAVGVKVNEFAIGMGPLLWKKQKGETQYSIRLFPIGGFCAMEGEDEDSEDARAFGNQPAWARALILVAGSFMNLVLAVVVLAGIALYIGTPTTTISEFSEVSPAREAGLLPGDKIIAIENQGIQEWNDVSWAIGLSEDDIINVVVERNGEEAKDVDIQAIKEEGTGRTIIGIMPEVTHNPFTAASSGVKATGAMAVEMYHVLKQLVTGEVSA